MTDDERSTRPLSSSWFRLLISLTDAIVCRALLAKTTNDLAGRRQLIICLIRTSIKRNDGLLQTLCRLYRHSFVMFIVYQIITRSAVNMDFSFAKLHYYSSITRARHGNRTASLVFFLQIKVYKWL